MTSISEKNLAHQILNFALFELFFTLAFASHVKAMFTDPGAVPRGTLTDEYIAQLELEQQNYGTVMYKCTKCECIKPERAHHCSVCQRCIRSDSYLFSPIFSNYINVIFRNGSSLPVGQ